LDAAVQLATLYYLAGDLERSRSMLIAAQPITATTDAKLTASRNYWDFFAKLLSLSHEPVEMPRDAATLYVIGESHSLSAHGIIVRYRGRQMRCAAQWIRGCKQWHLGNDKANRYKHKFHLVMEQIPRQSAVLLTIGEIDCRPDEGIMRAWKKSPDKPLDEFIRATVAGYVEYVTKIGARYEHLLIIGGVPATNVQSNALTTEDAKRFVALIRSFNATLKESAAAAGLDFLDIYALTDRGDGFATEQWHIDNYHLSPSAVAQAFDQHCLHADSAGRPSNRM